MRFKGGTVGLVMLAALVAAPAAFGSTASLASGGGTVVYRGDAGADSLTLSRYVNTRGTADASDDIAYYVFAETGISAGTGCQQIGSNLAACRVTQGLKRYDIATGSGDDRVELTGATSGGSADLGPGADHFTGLASGTAADSVRGAGGADTINGGAGNDGLDGGADADVLGGGAGDDAVAGGPGDDELEFGAPGASPGVGVGADDLRGGDGVDRLSYNDHPAAINVTLDEQPGDGSAGEGDNVHDDIETIIGTTLDDVLIGDDLGQDLYGHAGRDRIEGGGGADLLNGGSGEDVIRGGAGDDALEGSADGDLLDGGPGQDLFAGDNECVAQPCTGGADEIQARDGEQDTVNCGVGVDTAAVDALDIVALDAQQGCENVDRAAPAIAPLGGGDHGPGGAPHDARARPPADPDAAQARAPRRRHLPRRLPHPRAADPAQDGRGQGEADAHHRRGLAAAAEGEPRRQAPAQAPPEGPADARDRRDGQRRPHDDAGAPGHAQGRQEALTRVSGACAACAEPACGAAAGLSRAGRRAGPARRRRRSRRAPPAARRERRSGAAGSRRTTPASGGRRACGRPGASDSARASRAEAPPGRRPAPGRATATIAARPPLSRCTLVSSRAPTGSASGRLGSPAATAR